MKIQSFNKLHNRELPDLLHLYGVVNGKIQKFIVGKVDISYETYLVWRDVRREVAAVYIGKS